MHLYSLILILKVFTWMVVAYRNVNREHYYFFLLLAVIDPAFFIAKAFISITSNLFYLPLNILLYVVLKPPGKSILILLGIIGMLFLAEFSHTTINVSIMLIHFFIALRFVKFSIMEINLNHHLSIFYAVLFIFAVMTIVKAWFYTFDLENGLVHFFLFNTLQFVIGIFFIFYTKERAPKLSLERFF